MNRREALAALISLPQIASIQRADIKPDDVIVVECKGKLSLSGMESIRRKLTDIWPGRRIVVCDDDTRLRVVSQ